MSSRSANVSRLPGIGPPDLPHPDHAIHDHHRMLQQILEIKDEK
jgi:hypothetical protein